MTGGPLAGRAAIVTGAGQGVGEGIARALAARGASVVVAARRAETGEPVAEALRAAGGDAVCIETDVTRAADLDACVAATVERFGAVEMVVHNAHHGGVVHRIEALDPKVWDDNSRTAVWGMLHCARAAEEQLVRAGDRGRFVVITSPAALEGSADRPVYSAVKAAQRGMARWLARQWGRHGVTVNAVAPVAMSPSLEDAFRDDALRERVLGRAALGRVGDPATDIGPIVAFLCSDDARFVTGQTVICDGGRLMP